MSDDEYFDDDDIFTSAELDAIPLLNQLPSAPLPASGPSAALVVAPPPPLVSQASGTSQSNPVSFSEGSSNAAPASLQSSNTVPNVQPQNVASTSSQARQPARASGSRTSGARLSAIMNALRSTQSVPSTSQLPAQQSEIFGRPIGLLPFNTPKSSSNPEARKRASPSSSEGSPTRKSSRKRSRQSPATGAKRRRSSSCSPSKAVLEAVAREGKLEGLEMLEDELTCAICCDVYVAPQVTPCGHTTCGPCMKAWLTTNTNCPICRAHLSPRHKLATNFLGASMLDRLFAEALKLKIPDWSPGGVKQVEWDKRKRAWDQDTAAAVAASARLNRAPAAVPPIAVPPPPQRAVPLFRPAEDSDEDEDFDEDYEPPAHLYYLFN